MLKCCMYREFEHLIFCVCEVNVKVILYKTLKLSNMYNEFYLVSKLSIFLKSLIDVFGFLDHNSFVEKWNWIVSL